MAEQLHVCVQPTMLDAAPLSTTLRQGARLLLIQGGDLAGRFTLRIGLDSGYFLLLQAPVDRVKWRRIGSSVPFAPFR